MCICTYVAFATVKSLLTTSTIVHGKFYLVVGEQLSTLVISWTTMLSSCYHAQKSKFQTWVCFINCYDCNDGKHISRGHGVEMQISYKIIKNTAQTNIRKIIGRHKPI